MATRVFLLCADEKAIEAVSQVLDELEVSFEHFSDASLAVKRLSSQPYEAVVVDCDNETSASQVFNTLKGSSANQGAITIAIVDGKGGLPSAFRLGASLVLTKPVSLEQARGTIRNAIAMRRKNAPENKAMAATAAQGSATVEATASSPPAAPKAAENTSPAAIPTIPAPATKIAPAQTHAAPVPQASSAAPAKAPVLEAATVPVTPKRTLFSKAQSTSQLTEQLTAFKPAPAKPRTLESEPATSHDRTSHASPSAPTFGMLDKKESRKTSSGLLAVLTLLLAGGGFYAAWTMVPGFSNAVMSQYNSLYARITGAAPPSQAVTPAPVQPRPAVKPPVPPAPSTQNAAGQTTSNSTPATNPLPDGFAPAPAAPSEGFATDAAAKQSSTASSSSASAATSEDDTPVEVDEEAADAHVAYRVRPVYPEAARRKLTKGEVVVLTVVNKDGTVGSAKVKSGNPVFGPAAIAAVKQWRYQTYYQDGQPATFQTKVTLQFVPPGRR